MVCRKKSKLAKMVRAHRNFHFKSGLILDKGVRCLGVHRFPITSPLYKLTKLAGYANVAIASAALVVLED